MIYKEDWIEALRSGKYTQSRGTLFGPEPNSGCALGVLIDIAGETSYVLAGGPSAGDRAAAVAKRLLLALGSSFPDFANRVITMNDDYVQSFDEIANFIEALPLRSRPAQNARIAKKSNKEELCLVS